MHISYAYQHWRQRWRINTTTYRLHTRLRGRRLITASRNNTYNRRTNGTTITRKTKIGRKTTVWTFLKTNKQHLTRETWILLRKRNLKRETESLLITAQNNAIRTNNIKARIHKTQQNSKSMLCGDRDETIYHIISECSKLALKEYETRHDWVGKVFHRELCKKFKFDHMNKWYMHNQTYVLENETHTPMGFWHTHGSRNLGQTTRPYNNQQNKNLQNCGLCCSGWPQSKIERKLSYAVVVVASPNVIRSNCGDARRQLGGVVVGGILRATYRS